MSQNTRNIFNCQSNDKARYCILVPFPGVAECNGIELYHLQWHPLNLIRLEDDLRDPTLGTALGSQRHWASDHQTNLSLLWRCSFFSCSSLVLQLRQKRTSRKIDLRNLPPLSKKCSNKKIRTQRHYYTASGLPQTSLLGYGLGYQVSATILFCKTPHKQKTSLQKR